MASRSGTSAISSRSSGMAPTPFIVFRFAEQDVEDIVFRRSEILSSTPEVLAELNARSQGSDDLMGVWKKK